MIRRQSRLPLKIAAKADDVSELADLRNIGNAMLKDFKLLKIASIKQLASCDADELYGRIQRLAKSRHDPCVWDTYAAAIHQAKTGEALPWWDFTKVRKMRELRGTFVKGFLSGRLPVAGRR